MSPSSFLHHGNNGYGLGTGTGASLCRAQSKLSSWYMGWCLHPTTSHTSHDTCIISSLTCCWNPSTTCGNARENRLDQSWAQQLVRLNRFGIILEAWIKHVTKALLSHTYTSPMVVCTQVWPWPHAKLSTAPFHRGTTQSVGLLWSADAGGLMPVRPAQK